MNSILRLKHAKGDVQRKDKGRKRPQALRQAKKRAKYLKRKLISQSRQGRNSILEMPYGLLHVNLKTHYLLFLLTMKKYLIDQQRPNITGDRLKTDVLFAIYQQVRRQKYAYNPIRKHYNIHLFG